jgi:hypothetical protein
MTLVPYATQRLWILIRDTTMWQIWTICNCLIFQKKIGTMP